jgi:hypothetical protein
MPICNHPAKHATKIRTYWWPDNQEKNPSPVQVRIIKRTKKPVSQEQHINKSNGIFGTQIIAASIDFTKESDLKIFRVCIPLIPLVYNMKLVVLKCCFWVLVDQRTKDPCHRFPNLVFQVGESGIIPLLPHEGVPEVHDIFLIIWNIHKIIQHLHTTYEFTQL